LYVGTVAWFAGPAAGCAHTTTTTRSVTSPGADHFGYFHHARGSAPRDPSARTPSDPAHARHVGAGPAPETPPLV